MINVPSQCVVLPFTEAQSDPLFRQIAARLRTSGNNLTLEELHHNYVECMDHIVHAIGIFGPLEEVLGDDDSVNVFFEKQCLYNLLYERFNGDEPCKMSGETALKAGRLFLVREVPHAAEATNAFLNAMLHKCREARMLQVA